MIDTSTLDLLWDFEGDRCHLLLAIARSKDNEGVRATDQPTIRKVVEEEEEVDDKIEQLRNATSRFGEDYRLYATINARNARDALFRLLNESHNWFRKADMGDENVRKNFKRVDHEWKSILHQRESRDQKRFLFDLDEVTHEEYVEMMNILGKKTGLFVNQETPNGYHIVTEPFNYNEIETSIEYELKTDGMIFVGFL